MKMFIQETELFDFDIERYRIKENWKSNETMYKKLMKLMDLVEAEKWKEAYTELGSKWWQGYDNKIECPDLNL